MYENIGSLGVSGALQRRSPHSLNMTAKLEERSSDLAYHLSQKNIFALSGIGYLRQLLKYPHYTGLTVNLVYTFSLISNSKATSDVWIFIGRTSWYMWHVMVSLP